LPPAHLSAILPAVRKCLAAVFLFCTLADTVPAADFTYATSNSTVTLTKYTGRGESVVIPSEISGLPVTRIGDGAFAYTKLTSITIPRNVTSIGWSAFARCTNLTHATIPNHVTNIEREAFTGCTRLAQVTIPDGVTTIGKEAFAGCTSLTNLTLPNSLTNMDENAFAGCINLAGVTIPDRLTSIGEKVFSGCRLTNIIFPSSVTTLERYAFSGCARLTNVTLPGSVRDIWIGAFSWCTNQANFTIPNGTIRDLVFNGCTSLTNVTLGQGVTNIGPFAFVSYERNSCTSLATFTVDQDNPVYSSVAGALFDKGRTTLIQWPPGRDGHCAIPTGVTSIKSHAFSSRSKLTSVTLPNSVTNIGLGAFMYCANLTNINLPNRIIRIEPETFRGCTNLATITIPGSLTRIGDHALLTPSLRGIYFEGNTPDLGKDVFADSPFLTLYYRPDAKGWGPTFGGRPTAVWKP
jgi:hypothetical protein